MTGDGMIRQLHSEVTDIGKKLLDITAVEEIAKDDPRYADVAFVAGQITAIMDVTRSVLDTLKGFMR